MTILVVGGTGTVGSRVVARLASEGAPVRVMTRSPATAALPAGIEAVAGDLARPNSLPSAFAGVEALFLLTPMSRTEAAEGEAAVEAARGAGIGRIVYMTIHRLEDGTHVPHFGAKLPVVRAIRASGIPHAFLEPNNFFQNDLWLRGAILGAGVYPQPLGTVGLNRVDVDDIAAAAVVLLTGDRLDGASHPLVGREALTGPDCAESWSRALGREIRYGGDDLDAWSAQMAAFLPEWLVHDLRIMYQWQQDAGQIATPDDLARCRALLGRPPRPYDSFVAETAAAWSGDG